MSEGTRGIIPEESISRISALIGKARNAQVAWAALGAGERSRRLAGIRPYLAERGQEIAKTIATDTGKTEIDAMAAEVVPAAMASAYYLKNSARFQATTRISGGSPLLFNKRSRLTSIPYGVIGVISPWNYPFSIPFSEVLMALLAGNSVLLKVASSTLGVGRALAEAFSSLNLPEGVFTYVELPGREAGPAFILGGVDKLFFTGSTEVGKELMALAATRLTPLVLELGGADAMIVLDDADLERAALGALWAGYANAGQSCAGVQRILVQRGVYDNFSAILAARVSGLRVGQGSVGEFDMGPMISAGQKAEIRRQLKACLDLGAKALGGYDMGALEREDAFMPPVLLAGLSPDMPILTQEVFGPVLAILPFDGEAEAISMANGNPWGLSASVWSKNGARARRLAMALEAGTVMVNDHLMSHGLAECPWGGFKNSGIGKSHGKEGFREMLRQRVVVEDSLPFARKNLWWHPYSQSVYQGLSALLNFHSASSPVKRLGALPRLARFFLRYWEK